MHPQLVETTRPCVLCGGHQAQVVGTRSRSGAPLRSVACVCCGLVRADPLPHDPYAFYADEYRLAYKQTFEPRPKHVWRAGQVALDRLQRISPWMQGRLRVLDVGSGGGEFAHLLQRHGHEVHGVEPNRGYADWSERAYGLSVTRGFAGQVALAPASFDLITAWHVLEHTVDPGEVLRQLRAALRPGGRLVVEVPSVDATCQSPRSTFHEAHLFTFSTATLSQLAAQAGLRSVHGELSADGGNQLQVFEVTDACAAPTAQALAGEHARVCAVLAAHTPLSHAWGRHPWQRAGARWARLVREAVALWRYKDDLHSLLDTVYASTPAAGAGTRPMAAQTVPWRWVLAAWGLALAAEEILVDRSLLSAWGWDSATWWPYLIVQAAVVAALIRRYGARPRSGREWVRIGGWALPMLALPAIC